MKWLLCGLFFLTLFSSVSAQEFNAGFVQGLWYEDGGVFADTPTRIYVAIRNNTGADITGKVEFFDNDKRIERNNVSALDGRIIESWVDWTPAYGEHNITATLSRIELHKVGSSTQAIEVVSASASDSFFVDYDTDKDGVGNKEDVDDDGDGISDEEEIKNNTDPLDLTDPGPEKVKKATESDDEIDEDEGAGGSEASARDDTNGSNSPEGLERFLNDGFLDTTLSSISNRVNSTKEQIDGYRAERNSTNISTSQEKSTSTKTKTDLANSAINPLSTSTFSLSKYTKLDGQLTGFATATNTESDNDSSGFFSKVKNVAKLFLGSLYTLSLFLVSLYLSNPVIVQLTLLFLILFLIYKIAKRVGNRRNY